MQDNEEVVLWMNTVGPYHNRQETYGYYTLPFCMGPKESIGNSSLTVCCGAVLFLFSPAPTPAPAPIKISISTITNKLKTNIHLPY